MFGFELVCAQVSSGQLREWIREKFAILNLKPRRHHVGILIYLPTYSEI